MPSPTRPTDHITLPAARERAALRARIDDAVDRLGEDEIYVLAVIAERLAAGRRSYGELRLATDGRDWRQEMTEEVADALVYAACALAQGGPRA